MKSNRQDEKTKKKKSDSIGEEDVRPVSSLGGDVGKNSGKSNKLGNYPKRSNADMEDHSEFIESST